MRWGRWVLLTGGDGPTLSTRHRGQWRHAWLSDLAVRPELEINYWRGKTWLSAQDVADLERAVVEVLGPLAGGIGAAEVRRRVRAFTGEG